MAVKIKVSRSHQRKILQGHPWVTHYQIREISGNPGNGDLAVVYDDRNRFLAIGLFDPRSDIRLRILQTRDPANIDEHFFRARFQSALNLRQGMEPDTTGYRLVNGENDGFPGLVVDRYADTLALKIYTAAWIPYLDMLSALFCDECGTERAVLLMSRHVMRTHESPLNHGQVLVGDALVGPVRFLENGLKFEADLLHGHKTGFYLDQRENRKTLRDMAKGKSVLNVFSYTGGFSVYTMAGGCRSVTEIDVSRAAQEVSWNHMALNFGPGFSKDVEFEQMCGDAFKQMAVLQDSGRQFDLVILDPPAFANNKKNKPNALQAYLRLAKAGAKRTRKDGVLFAASCSSQVRHQEFYRAVDLGIRQTGRSFEKLLKTGHPKDHPVEFSEGSYLKAIYCKLKS